MKQQLLLMLLGLMMVGGAGFLTATALSQGQATPARTVTVDIPTGQQGPTGPAGPKGDIGPTGPAGATGGGPCDGAPLDYSPGFLRINTPGGHVIIWTCLEPA